MTYNCFTVTKAGARRGIRVGKTDTPTIQVGEVGRGRSLVSVALPEGSVIESNRVSYIPTSEPKQIVVCIRDHSGFRGSWSAVFSDGITLIAEGRCAQGTAGRMGSGPEYLVRGGAGETMQIRRRGRLYGKPSCLEVRFQTTGIEVVDVEAEAVNAAAAAAF